VGGRGGKWKGREEGEGKWRARKGSSAVVVKRIDARTEQYSQFIKSRPLLFGVFPAFDKLR